MAKNAISRYADDAPHSIKTLVPAGLKSIAYDLSYGNSGNWGNVYIGLPGTTRDYAREAGDLWDNSIIASGLNWTARTFWEAPPIVIDRTKGEAETDQTIPDHPLLDILDTPNEWDTGADLAQALALSYNTDGNAYILKERNGAGQVVRLRYLEHWLTEPRGDRSALITHYEYLINGRWEYVPIRDMIHWKFGKDPLRPRKGLAPIRAGLREICADNEASEFIFALLKNGAVPGLMVYPKGEATISDRDKREELKQTIDARFAGSNRGSSMVLSTEMGVEQVGYNPEQLKLGDVREAFEARVCALMGINPVVLALASGLKQSTYNNQQEAKASAYESYLMPMKRSLADVLRARLLPEFDQTPGRYLDWDYSNVKCLREDQDAIAKRAAELFTAGVVTRTEARRVVGQPEDLNDPDRNEYKSAPAPVAMPAKPGDTPPAKSLQLQRDLGHREYLRREYRMADDEIERVMVERAKEYGFAEQ